MAESGKTLISIVIPVFNEADNIRPLHSEITQVLKGRFSYEIIYIDDGSSDNSLSCLIDIAKNDPYTRVIRFRRNFGQTAALSAGFKYARGNIVVPLDGDGQNDPTDIPALVSKQIGRAHV